MTLLLSATYQKAITDFCCVSTGDVARGTGPALTETGKYFATQKALPRFERKVLLAKSENSEDWQDRRELHAFPCRHVNGRLILRDSATIQAICTPEPSFILILVTVLKRDGPREISQRSRSA
ncbi:unnamed protein product [Peronospora belbahrii]|uniref:Uncharacterized protein n=1 Tax=Peronospora belbahrii TaxID=622444 RepID=A0ABN8D8N8_9STRA|nr:unnamed protein product [Peronospora belbahrii]